MDSGHRGVGWNPIVTASDAEQREKLLCRLRAHFWLSRKGAKSGESIEFAARGGLIDAYVAGDNLGFEIVFTFDGASSEATEHGNLADVGERVGNGALE